MLFNEEKKSRENSMNKISFVRLQTNTYQKQNILDNLNVVII